MLLLNSPASLKFFYLPCRQRHGTMWSIYFTSCQLNSAMDHHSNYQKATTHWYNIGADTSTRTYQNQFMVEFRLYKINDIKYEI